MRKPFPIPTRLLQTLVVLGLALAAYLLVGLALGERTVHALPEYAERTGEPCATCHVSAGGGGPRTLRGMLWTARGRPDEVPDLPGQLLAPTANEGFELYDIACAGCHGSQGQGLFGIGLADRGISATAIRSFIINGIPELGMPAFDGRFTPEQLETLAQFVARMGEGDVPPDEYPLPAPQHECIDAEAPSCGAK